MGSAFALGGILIGALLTPPLAVGEPAAWPDSFNIADAEILFSSASATYWVAKLRIGSLAHDVTFDDGATCRLSAWAEEVLGSAAVRGGQ